MLLRRPILALAALALPLAVARAQTPQQIIQQVVDAERNANQNDRSLWIFLDQSKKPTEQVTKWIGTASGGDAPW